MSAGGNRGSHRPRGRRGQRPEERGQRPQERGTRSASIDPAREAAHRALSAVESDDAYSNLILPHVLADYGLSGRDAAFATELVYGTLRLQGRYDALIARFLDGRKVSSLQPAMRVALRLGAHQLLAMRIPERAAVYETVNLVKVVAGPAPVAMANAVLRNIAKKSAEEWEQELSAEQWASHPEWIVNAFRQSLALEGAAGELPDLLEANNTPAGPTLVARPGLLERDELVELTGGEPTEYSPYGVRTRGGVPGSLAEVRSARAGVQDEGSQLMALLALEAPLEGPDEVWLDMCAGPGGKAAILAAEATRRGAHLIANEVAEHRAELVERAVAPSRDAVTVVAGDGRYIGEDNPGYFDRILLDAPCTGLGSLRRRPESRWRRTTADLGDLTRLQQELIDSAVAALRPGGVLAYVTCSPHPAETVTQVAEAVRRHGLELLDAGEVLADYGLDVGARDAHPTPGTVQLWPHRHETDAMFGALLRRPAEDA